MTVRCAVRGCRTGSYSDKRQKNRDGLKQTTLFTVPKTAALLEKWNRALNQEFSKGDKVCELHFADLDIKRSDDTLMPDGTIFSIPMQKYSLRKNAVPVDFGNRENKAPLNKVISTSQEISQTEEKENQADEEVTVNIPQKESEVDSKHVTTDETEMSTENSVESLSNLQTELTTEIDQESLSINDTVNIFMNDHQYYFDDKKPGQYYYYNSKVAACFAITTTTEDTKQKINSSLSDQTSNHEETSQSINEVAPQLSIKIITDYLLKNPLPRSWSWMKCTRMDNGITFIQILACTRKVRCSVQLQEDLSVTVHTADEEISMEIEFDIPSPESIIKILETVEKLKICSASGIEKEGKQQRSPYCTGVVTPNEEYKISMQCDRCMACRKTRRILLVREKEPKIDIKTKYERAKRELDLMKRKYRCLEEKLKVKNKRLKAITEMIKSVNKYNKVLE